jgi:integrase
MASTGHDWSDWALDILKRTHKVSGCEYVFPHISGRYRGLPYGQIRKTFNKALKAAGLEGVRIHDLRHTFGSWLGDAVSLHMV